MVPPQGLCACCAFCGGRFPRSTADRAPQLPHSRFQPSNVTPRLLQLCEPSRSARPMLYLFMSFTGCVLSRTPAPQGRGFGRCPSFFTAEASVPGTWQVNPGAGRGDEQPCEAGSLREPPSGTGSGGLGSDAIPGQLWGARQGPRENVPVAELSGHGGQAGPGSGSQAWGRLRWHRGPSGSGPWPEHAARSDCPN